MTSLRDRPNTALLVVDVQNDVVANAHQRDEVIANISTLVDRARAQQVPVIWVQHADDELVEGSDGWQYVPELQRQESEPLVHKHYGDSFEDTTLESELAAAGRRSARRHRRPDRRLHPRHAPRRVRPRLRHPPGRRRPHHRGLLRVRPATGRQGHRPHQHVLDVADRPRAHGRRGRDRRRQLRGHRRGRSGIAELRVGWDEVVELEAERDRRSAAGPRGRGGTPPRRSRTAPSGRRPRSRAASRRGQPRVLDRVRERSTPECG